MSTGGEHPPIASESLDERVDALLSDLERAEGTNLRDLGEAADEPAIEDATDAPSVSDAGEAAQRAVEQVEKNVEELLAQVEPIEGAEEVAAASAARVESTSSAEAERAATDGDGDLASLDEALSKLAGELSENDFESAAAASAAPITAAGAPPLPPPTRAREGMPERTAPSEGGGAIKGRVEQEVAAEHAPPAGVEARAVLARVGEAGAAAGRVLGPVVMRTARAVSKPLDSRPPAVRDAIGWAALVTVFWAVSVWTYILIFRKPIVPKAGEAPVILSTPQTDHEAMVRAAEEAVRARAHEASGGDSHGSKKAGASGGKDSHTKPAAKKKDAAHASSGH